MGAPLGTVVSRLHRRHRKLREQLHGGQGRIIVKGSCTLFRVRAEAGQMATQSFAAYAPFVRGAVVIAALWRRVSGS
jgi:hypothetical protein